MTNERSVNEPVGKLCMLQKEVDILENSILKKYSEVLDTLLCDRATDLNILWATENYEHLGKEYSFKSQILANSITGDNGNVIMPRVQKNKDLKQSRSKEMAEVFTPSWVCNAQNNLVDSAWFKREGVFNKQIMSPSNAHAWKVNNRKIAFKKNKTWQDYVKDKRLEITCGEAPYITSRYDTTTGEFIPVENRIGLLDRKLRVVSENIDTANEWLEAAKTAYESTYAFEWQGDSLLLAREAMLITFIENFTSKFSKEPALKYIQSIANIISWNVWQMDGLKGVVPKSCNSTTKTSSDLFNNFKEESSECVGCNSKNILLHNGTYCKIVDWDKKDKKNAKMGTIYRFVDLLEK